MPRVAGDIDVNFCRNANCDNFGVRPLARPTGRSPRNAPDGYSRAGAGSQVLGLSCHRCTETSTVLSNEAISEEVIRVDERSLGIGKSTGCRTQGCANHHVSVEENSAAYQRFGSTSTGSIRFRCRECLSTFSVSKSGNTRLRQPEKSEIILKLLVNKMPMRRICEVADVKPKVLYDRISRLAAQCRAFAHGQETLFLAHASLERLHLNIDRQDHNVNWGSAMDRNVLALRAVATADVVSGYVLAQDLNYDSEANPRALELEARRIGDIERYLPFRKHARLWLPHEAASRGQGQMRVPGVGGVVHENYSIAAHLYRLRRWVSITKYVQLSIDQDPGLDRLSAAIFADIIQSGALDLYLVRINKDMTVSQRKSALAHSERILSDARALHPDAKDYEIVRNVLMQRWQGLPEASRRQGKHWIPHPFPTMNEPEKAVMAIVTRHRTDAQVVAGIARATLRGLDRYFMQVRRKVNLLERPLHTAGSSYRSWHGYNAYSPRVVMEVLDIFRVVYNFHLRGEDKKTPAQRIGLIKSVVTLDELCRAPLQFVSLPAGRKNG